MTEIDTEHVGYRQPPSSTRYRKGQSGNPKGRRRGQHRVLPYEAVFGQRVTVREAGVEKRMPADEAFLLYMLNQGLKGDTTSNRKLSEALERVRNLRADVAPLEIVVVNFSPTRLYEALKMAVTLDRYRLSAHTKLQPWIVQAALDRMHDRRLGREEQKIIYDATRTPSRVRWPEWWGDTDEPGL